MPGNGIGSPQQVKNSNPFFAIDKNGGTTDIGKCKAAGNFFEDN